jgi:hypothetical protein
MAPLLCNMKYSVFERDARQAKQGFSYTLRPWEVPARRLVMTKLPPAQACQAAGRTLLGLTMRLKQQVL